MVYLPHAWLNVPETYKIEFQILQYFTLLQYIQSFSFLSSSKVVWINQIHAVIFHPQTSKRFSSNQWLYFCSGRHLLNLLQRIVLEHRSEILFKVLLLHQLKKFSHRKLCKNLYNVSQVKMIELLVELSDLTAPSFIISFIISFMRWSLKGSRHKKLWAWYFSMLMDF